MVCDWRGAPADHCFVVDLLSEVRLPKRRPKSKWAPCRPAAMEENLRAEVTMCRPLDVEGAHALLVRVEATEADW